MDESELVKARREKIVKIKELGWNPYSPSYDKTHMVKEAIASEGKVVKTAGKLLSFREHGNIAFADLFDETGKIRQVVAYWHPAVPDGTSERIKA